MMSRVIKWAIVSICQEEELQKERGSCLDKSNMSDSRGSEHTELPEV